MLWLGVEKLADLITLDARFLDFVVLSGQGKYVGSIVSQVLKRWCQRHTFDDQTLPVEDLTNIEEFITLEYDIPFDLSTPTRRIGGCTVLLAVEEWGKEIVDLGFAKITATATA